MPRWNAIYPNDIANNIPIVADKGSSPCASIKLARAAPKAQSVLVKKQTSRLKSSQSIASTLSVLEGHFLFFSCSPFVLLLFSFCSPFVLLASFTAFCSIPVLVKVKRFQILGGVGQAWPFQDLIFRDEWR